MSQVSQPVEHVVFDSIRDVGESAMPVEFCDIGSVIEEQTGIIKDGGYAADADALERGERL
jgi:hypothetical protein